jgi:hypothetical protein
VCKLSVTIKKYINDFISGTIKALCYKRKCCGFTRLGEYIFSIYLLLPAALGHGVYSASNRNEYQKQKNNISGE